MNPQVVSQVEGHRLELFLWIPKKSIVLAPVDATTVPLQRHSRAKMAIAIGVAMVSDALSIWITFAPPLQWTLDLATAVVLFVDFRKTMGSPAGAVMEAIPGMGVFPLWVFIVAFNRPLRRGQEAS